MKEINNQYFSKQQIKAGELSEFIELLIKQSYGKGDSYNELHIKPVDLGAVIVEWTSEPWSKEYGGHWQYIQDDEDEVVMKYYSFPDNHSELFETEEEYKEALNEWLEEHKDEEWYKNEYGQWRSKKEQREWEKALKVEVKDE